MKKDKKIIDKLINLYNVELDAHNHYMYYASILDKLRVDNVAKFVKNLANDKTEAHITRTYDFLIFFKETLEINLTKIKTDILQTINKEKSIRKNVIFILNEILKNELKNREIVNELAEFALNNKDYETFEFIQWFIKDYVKDISELEKLIELLWDEEISVHEAKI
ncbi:MAG: ferritin-like domain-containing protein [Mycoplasmoidaceae bacterium]